MPSADENLAAVEDTLAQLDSIGPDAYATNAATLIAEGMLRAAAAEAVTNRIRLLSDLIDRQAYEVTAERNRLLDQIIDRQDTDHA